MSTTHISHRSAVIAETLQPWKEFIAHSTWANRRHDPGISDFTFAAPHEMPLNGMVSALQDWSTPLNKDWYACRTNDPVAQAAIAESLRARIGVAFEPTDILLTNGGSAAIAAALRAVADPGDEVIVCNPADANYQVMIHAAGMVPVCVDVDPESFDLDLEAIRAAINSRTRILIVNAPHEPSGKIYSPETLQQLANLLHRGSADYGRPIYIVSDESSARIVFNERRSYSPAEFYADTLLAYGYSKILLSPGQRIGYVAIPSTMPDRDTLREHIFDTQIALGWSFPNALLQHALPTLERLSVDIEHLQRKRDRLVSHLLEIGYDVRIPEATFYLLAHLPIEDDVRFTELLAEHAVFVLPGSMFGIPGFIRVSLTASDEMIERSLPGFAAAYERSLTDAPVQEEFVAAG